MQIKQQISPYGERGNLLLGFIPLLSLCQLSRSATFLALAQSLYSLTLLAIAYAVNALVYSQNSYRGGLLWIQSVYAAE